MSQYQQAKRKQSPFAWIAVSLALAAIVIVATLFFLQRYRVNRLLDRLNAEPGIEVTSLHKRGGTYHFNGLRDPLSADPAKWLPESRLDPRKIAFHWEPYQAMHPQFLLTRARALLNPPSTVTLSLKDGVLTGKGKAPHSWISESRRLIRAIPGIDRFNEEQLVEIEAEEMYAIKKKIEDRVFRFLIGTANLLPGEEQKLDLLAQDILKLNASRRPVEKIGHCTGDWPHGHNG